MHNDHQNKKVLTRRSFLQNTGIASAAGLASSVWLSPTARAGGGSTRDVFIQVFLRGGMDGLSVCVPYMDPELYTARPTIAVPPAGATDGAINLDGFFGLNPNAASLMTPFSNGHLAFVQAAGSTDPTRSHFDAFQAMERGYPNQDYQFIDTGWLARHLSSIAPTSPVPLRAMAMTDTMPLHLDGAPQTLPIPDATALRFPGSPGSALQRERVIQKMYGEAQPLLKGAATSTFDTIDTFAALDFDGYVPSNGAVYPASPFGTQLRQVAVLIKAGIGLEAVSLDYGGWDHHNQIGANAGTMAGMLADLSASVEAFYLDMTAYLNEFTMVLLSEFGRRVGENGSSGVDHGHGNCMMVMGGHVNGGQVFANWPGLAPANLDQGDLAITTDYRAVLGEILLERMESIDIVGIFPQFNYMPLGLIQ